MFTGPLYNEKELLRDVAKGDEKAFRLLFDAYRNRLYFYIIRLTASKEAAEDVLQNTFLKLWLNRKSLEGVENFNAWLFRIAQNDVISILRRKVLERNLQHQPVLHDPASPADFGEQLHYKQIREVIQKAVDTLPPQQQKVYLLRREEGLKINEIAHALGLSPFTVKKHLTEAQKAIRGRLDSFFRDEGVMLLFLLGLLHK